MKKIVLLSLIVICLCSCSAISDQIMSDNSEQVVDKASSLARNNAEDLVTIDFLAKLYDNEQQIVTVSEFMRYEGSLVDSSLVVKQHNVSKSYKWTYGYNGKEFLSEVYDEHDESYQHIWFDPATEAVIPIAMPGIPTQKVSCEIYLGDWIVWSECPYQPTPAGYGWTVKALNLVSGESLVIDRDAGVELKSSRGKIQQPLNLSGDDARFVYTAFDKDSEGAICQVVRMFDFNERHLYDIYVLDDISRSNIFTCHVNGDYVVFTVSSTEDYYKEYGRTYIYSINSGEIIQLESDINIINSIVSGPYLVALHGRDGAFERYSLVISDLCTMKWIREIRPEDIGLTATDTLMNLSVSGNYASFTNQIPDRIFVYDISSDVVVDLNQEQICKPCSIIYMGNNVLVWAGTDLSTLKMYMEYVTLQSREMY